jgi:hypothetical protein
MDQVDFSLVQKRLQQTLKKVEHMKTNLRVAQTTLASKEAALRKAIADEASPEKKKDTPPPSLAAALKKLAQDCNCGSPEKLNFLTQQGHRTK